MNRRNILLTILVIVLIGAGAHRAYMHMVAAKETTTKRKISYDAFPFPENSLFKKYMFPLLVNSFTKSLGSPDNTIIDENEGCPIGQVHNWCLRDQNLEILVLGDNYKSKAEYAAHCRLYAIRKCTIDTPTTFDGIWGIKLGDADTVVRELLEKLVKDNPSIHLTQDSNGSPVPESVNDFETPRVRI
jgi:hypothetical protein